MLAVLIIIAVLLLLILYALAPNMVEGIGCCLGLLTLIFLLIGVGVWGYVELTQEPRTAVEENKSSLPDGSSPLSQMSDIELLQEAARECGVHDYGSLSDGALRRVIKECYAESEADAATYDEYREFADPVDESEDYVTLEDMEAAAQAAADDAIAAAESRE